jgi:hypothetical protein
MVLCIGFWVVEAVLWVVLLNQYWRVFISKDLNLTVFDCFQVPKPDPVLDKIFCKFCNHSSEGADQPTTLLFGSSVGDPGNLLNLIDETFGHDIIIFIGIEPGQG